MICKRCKTQYDDNQGACPACGYVPEYHTNEPNDGMSNGGVQSQYSAPQNEYGAPQNSYSAPQSQYSAPQNQYSIPQNPYGEPPKKGKGLAIAAMVVGIVSLCAFCFWPVAIIGGILAIIFGAVAIKSAGRGMAIAGIITGAVAVVLAILFIVLLAAGVAGFYDSIWDNGYNYDFDNDYSYDYDYGNDWEQDFEDIFEGLSTASSGGMPSIASSI